MLTKTLLAIFAAVAATAAPTAPDNRDLEERAAIPGLCSGGRIEGPINVLGGKATVYVHYAAANGGTNCAYATNNGGEADMSITMLDTTTYKREDVDQGHFSQYAGPVSLTGMANHCFQVTVSYNGGLWYSPRGWHCGGGSVLGS